MVRVSVRDWARVMVSIRDWVRVMVVVIVKDSVHSLKAPA